MNNFLRELSNLADDLRLTEIRIMIKLQVPEYEKYRALLVLFSENLKDNEKSSRVSKVISLGDKLNTNKLVWR